MRMRQNRGKPRYQRHSGNYMRVLLQKTSYITVSDSWIDSGYAKAFLPIGNLKIDQKRIADKSHTDRINQRYTKCRFNRSVYIFGMTNTQNGR